MFFQWGSGNYTSDIKLIYFPLKFKHELFLAIGERFAGDNIYDISFLPEKKINNYVCDWKNNILINPSVNGVYHYSFLGV